MVSKEASVEIARLVQVKEAQVGREKAEKSQEEKLQEASGKTFYEAYSILREFGIKQTTSMGTGAGGRVVGVRVETVTFLETAPVTVDTDSGKVILVLKQKISSRPNYQFGVDSLDILCQSKLREPSFVLYSLSERSCKNVEGQLRTLEEFDTLNQVLDLLKEELKEQSKETAERLKQLSKGRKEKPQQPQFNGRHHDLSSR